MRKKTIILILVFFLFSACQVDQGRLPHDRLITGPLFAVSSEPNAPPEALLILNKDRQDPPQYYLSKFDPNTALLFWEAPVESEAEIYAHNARIFVSRARIFLIIDGKILALDLETGEELWQKGLSGKVDNQCDDCLRIIEDQLFFLSRDGTLIARDVANGEINWQKSLNEDQLYSRSLYYSQGFIIVQDWLEPEDRSRAGLLLIDPDSGGVMDVLTSTCPDGEGFFPDEPFSMHDAFSVFENAGKALLIMDGIRQPCLSLFSIATAEVDYLSLLPDTFDLPFFEPASANLYTSAGLLMGEEGGSDVPEGMLDFTASRFCSLLLLGGSGESRYLHGVFGCEMLDPVLWVEPVVFFITEMLGPAQLRVLNAYDLEKEVILWTISLKSDPDSRHDSLEVAIRRGQLVMTESYTENHIQMLLYRVLDPLSGAEQTVHQITPIGEDPWELHQVFHPDGFYYLSENSLCFYAFESRESEIIWPAFYIGH